MDTDTIRGPPLAYGQQSAELSTENRTGQNIHKEN